MQAVLSKEQLTISGSMSARLHILTKSSEAGMLQIQTPALTCVVHPVLCCQHACHIRA